MNLSEADAKQKYSLIERPNKGAVTIVLLSLLKKVRIRTMVTAGFIMGTKFLLPI